MDRRNSPIYGGSHLFMLPTPQATRSDEHRAASAVFQSDFQGRLPRVTGDQIPFVKPRLQSFRLESPREFFDQRLVSAVV
jgi:hypothetical protein